MKTVQHRHYPDKYGYMLETSRTYTDNPDNGRGDAIGRTVLAAIIYREQRFIDVIYYSFWQFLNGKEWKPIRHIEQPRTHDFSRDHAIWFVIWLIFFCPWLKFNALRIPWKISEKFNQSFDMFLWIRAACQGKWIDRLIYWAVASIYLRAMIVWNNWIRKRAGIESQHYLKFKATQEKDLNKKELFARKYSFPGYSIEIQAWMIYVLPDDWYKKRLKRLLPGLVEKSNYFIRMIAGDVFDAQDIEGIKNYTGMDALRSSRRLDKTTDIDLFPLFPPDDQPPYNMDIDQLSANIETQTTQS